MMCLPIGQRVRALAQLKETFRVKLKKSVFPSVGHFLACIISTTTGSAVFGLYGI